MLDSYQTQHKVRLRRQMQSSPKQSSLIMDQGLKPHTQTFPPPPPPILQPHTHITTTTTNPDSAKTPANKNESPTISCAVVSREFLEVGCLKSLMVSIHCAHDAWPRLLEHLWKKSRSQRIRRWTNTKKYYNILQHTENLKTKENKQQHQQKTKTKTLEKSEILTKYQTRSVKPT